ncbi:hypothetical protein V3C99_018210 [Haemonchus contortus]
MLQDYPLLIFQYRKVCQELDRHLRRFLAYKEKRATDNSQKRAIFALIKYKIKPRPYIPLLKDESGRRFLTDSQKAEALAQFFFVFAPNPDANSAVAPMRCVCSNSIIQCVVTSQEVRRVLNCSASVPFDGIPQIVYKNCATSLSEPICMILDASLMYCEVPSCWKESVITAIPKISEPKLVSSFRPISITAPPAKVLERILRDKIASHLMKNNLIPIEQHGFISSASTVTLIADCIFDWNLVMNEGKGVVIIYFDLTTAFDKVSHEKLPLKLQQLGIECNILSWIQSYLEDRHMCVRVDNSFS